MVSPWINLGNKRKISKADDLPVPLAPNNKFNDLADNSKLTNALKLSIYKRVNIDDGSYLNWFLSIVFQKNNFN
jgi:hypothetical protein